MDGGKALRVRFLEFDPTKKKKIEKKEEVKIRSILLKLSSKSF